MGNFAMALDCGGHKYKYYTYRGQLQHELTYRGLFVVSPIIFLSESFDE
jgi:hypothetical protein